MNRAAILDIANAYCAELIGERIMAVEGRGMNERRLWAAAAHPYHDRRGQRHPRGPHG